MTTKICKKCNTEKEITSFVKEKRNPDGYTSTCKDCRNKKRRQEYIKKDKYSIKPLEQSDFDLTIIKDLGTIYISNNSKRRHRFAIFECKYCGKHFKSQTASVKRKSTTSCGCYFLEKTRERSTKHGLINTKYYTAWSDMKDRCYNKNNIGYLNYGGRGIKIQDNWIDNYELFYNHLSTLENFNKPKFTLDRINNDGNYEEGNIRLASSSVQNSNKRAASRNTSGYIGIDKRKNEIFRSRINFNKKTIYTRHFKTLEDAIRARNKFIIDNNLPHTIQEYKNV